ncbi:unnamed protein product, partial [Lampetra planeri]
MTASWLTCRLLSLVSGAEGAVFSKSVETPHVRAEPFKELRAKGERKTPRVTAERERDVCDRTENGREKRKRTWSEGHNGQCIQILAEAGDIQAICRNELRLESKDGEISLDARRIRLMRLPEGKASTSSSSSGTRQTVYE